MSLSHIPSLCKGFFISCFINGLRVLLELLVKHPGLIIKMMKLAKLEEEKNRAICKFQRNSHARPIPSTVLSAIQTPSKETFSPNHATAPTTKQLIPQEVRKATCQGIVLPLR